MTSKYGFIYEPPKDEDWVFGASSQIPGEVLQPDGQWDKYLPEVELQNRGFEPYACATFGTLNAIEIILKRKYGFTDNYSDRYVAQKTGTAQKKGNDPQLIAEFIRKNGDVDESVWPYTNTSFEEYYADPPVSLAPKAKTFTDHYVFTHDIVPSDPKSMKEALKYSPLGISVFGWIYDEDTDLYTKGEGSDNHWCLCYGHEDGKYWKVYDTYDNGLKKVEWAHKPMLVKRYHIDLAPQTVSFLDAAVRALNAFLAWFKSQDGAKDPPAPEIKPTIPPAPVQTTQKRLEQFAGTIKRHEGWTVGTIKDGVRVGGSRSWRNCNAGNCRYSSEGYLAMYGKVGKDKDNFAIFSTEAIGELYLMNLIRVTIKKHPTWSIYAFFANKYAPKSDGNDPVRYAKVAADGCGLTPQSPISDLLTN
jgi:hypothetical protein